MKRIFFFQNLTKIGIEMGILFGYKNISNLDESLI